MNRPVTCVDCGKVLSQDDAYLRVSIGTVVGRSATQYLCGECRYPGESVKRCDDGPDVLTRPYEPGVDAGDVDEEYDGIYEGEW